MRAPSGQELRNAMLRTTGRDYRVSLDALDDETRRELQRFFRDVAYDKQAAVNNARRQPWRR
jgi:ribosome recycling factor